MDVPLDKRRLQKLIREMKSRDHFPVTHFPLYLGSSRNQPHLKLANELVDECVEYILMMTSDERAALRKKGTTWVRFSDWDNPTISEERKTRFLAEGYVQWALHERFFHVDHVVDGSREDSLILEQYPELEDRLDKDGLLILGEGLDPVDGAILYKDHALNYHQFLRRGFTSKPNYDFLVPFVRCYHETSNTNEFRIAVDHTRLMKREDYSRAWEFDTWYGPPFDTDRLDDPEAIGLTVIGRNKASLFELSNHLHFTDFLWAFKEGIKTLQIEEVHDKEDALGKYVINRYVHSERDVEQGVFRHLDGAAKVYNVIGYDSRRDIHLPDARACHVKRKLWRIDGEIELEDWSSLISLFYKSNEMIIEYFDADAFEEMFELRIRDFDRWKAKQERESK